MANTTTINLTWSYLPQRNRAIPLQQRQLCVQYSQELGVAGDLDIVVENVINQQNSKAIASATFYQLQTQF